MQTNHEKSIVRNIFTLTKETANVNLLAFELSQNQVLISNEERQRILTCADEESECNLLYETILRRSVNAETFGILVSSLKKTGNAHLSKILEDSLSSLTGDNAVTTRPKKFSQLTKRVSCSDFYEDVLDSKLINGKEMGISEILEEDQNLKRNCSKLVKVMELESGPNNKFESIPEFVVQSTLVLCEWSRTHKKNATLGKLVARLNFGKYFVSAARIRKMFERADNLEEKWEIDAQNCRKSISGKEKKIVHILDANPSFCLHSNRLFFLLNLPMEYYLLYNTDPSFVKNGTGMLKLWRDLNERDATIQRLTLLLLQNGHPFTAEKILKLLR